MMILGQEKLCNQIDNLTMDEFPRSLMLVGARGSGKHLIVDYIANKFKLTVRDITKTLNLETIEELYNRVEPYLYIINANELSVKEENVILKFLEEPLKNSYIVLLCETEVGLLNTIINRCQIWYLQNYSKELLRSFLSNNNEYVLTVASTPGQVIELCNTSFEDMLELADKIIDKIHIASVANTLSLSNKLNFKNESDKFDVRLFVDVLLQRFVEKYRTNSDNKYSTGYLRTVELKKKLYVHNLDCKALFEKYLVELRAIMRGEVV